MASLYLENTELSIEMVYYTLDSRQSSTIFAATCGVSIEETEQEVKDLIAHRGYLSFAKIFPLPSPTHPETLIETLIGLERSNINERTGLVPPRS